MNNDNDLNLHSMTKLSAGFATAFQVIMKRIQHFSGALEIVFGKKELLRRV